MSVVATSNARMPDAQPPANDAIVRTFVIRNKKGLHARASAIDSRFGEAD